MSIRKLAVLLVLGGMAAIPALAHGPHSLESMAMPGATKTTSSSRATVSPAQLKPGKPQAMLIFVRDGRGRPDERFALQHEKLMHLIVVSDDLTFFDHLHPQYVGGGRFRVTANLPASGSYTAFADYLPQGGSPQVSALHLQAGSGSTASVPLTPDSPLSKRAGDLTVTLKLDSGSIAPGRQTPLTFFIKDGNGNPVTDLQPYLGAMGHLVVIRQSPVLTAADYLHAHPEDQGGHSMGAMAEMHHTHGERQQMAGMDQMAASQKAEPGSVSFKTVFPGPGTYRLWAQFQRNGKIITADYTIAV